MDKDKRKQLTDDFLSKYQRKSYIKSQKHSFGREEEKTVVNLAVDESGRIHTELNESAPLKKGLLQFDRREDVRTKDVLQAYNDMVMKFYVEVAPHVIVALGLQDTNSITFGEECFRGFIRNTKEFGDSGAFFGKAKNVAGICRNYTAMKVSMESALIKAKEAFGRDFTNKIMTIKEKIGGSARITQIVADIITPFSLEQLYVQIRQDIDDNRIAESLLDRYPKNAQGVVRIGIAKKSSVRLQKRTWRDGEMMYYFSEKMTKTLGLLIRKQKEDWASLESLEKSSTHVLKSTGWLQPEMNIDGMKALNEFVVLGYEPIYLNATSSFAGQVFGVDVKVTNEKLLDRIYHDEHVSTFSIEADIEVEAVLMKKIVYSYPFSYTNLFLQARDTVFKYDDDDYVEPRWWNKFTPLSLNGIRRPIAAFKSYLDAGFSLARALFVVVKEEERQSAVDFLRTFYSVVRKQGAKTFGYVDSIKTPAEFISMEGGELIVEKCTPEGYDNLRVSAAMVMESIRRLRGNAVVLVDETVGKEIHDLCLLGASDDFAMVKYAGGQFEWINLDFMHKFVTNTK